MKKYLFYTLSIFILATRMVLAVPDKFNPKQRTQSMNHKNLIVYFSWSGNTQFIAEKIKEQIGGDLLKIEPETPYDNDYQTTAYGRAKEEHEKNIHPAIKTPNLLLSQYDTIFLGTPVWWYTMAPAVMTYLEQNNFKGKTIVPFVTHGGGGGYTVDKDMAKLAKGATVLKPLVLYGKGSAKVSEDIANWLAQNSITARDSSAAPKSVESVNKEKVFYKQTYTGIKIVGELYKPSNFQAGKKYSAIVVVHPAGGVKEQVSGLYARRLAEQGFVTLAYDAAYQGESGGEPHFLENPESRVEDVRSSIDYLTTLPFVDTEKIGVLGICAGGGYAFHAAETEVRIQAIATVSAFDLGRARRQGLNDTLTLAQQQQKLQEAADQRTREAQGAPIKYNNYVPNLLQEIPSNATIMYRQGYEYYRTPMAQHPRSENKYIFSNYAQQAAFTAFDHPEWIAPRSALFIVGEKAESAYFSKEAYDKIPGYNKQYVVIPGATHIELYYKPEYVSQAVEKLSAFFDQNLREGVSSASSNAVPALKLNNGVLIPQLGLGTYKLAEGEETYNAVLTALKVGYRHIDTAHAYGNERSVGRAIKDSGIPREEIWITSKLWPNEFGEGVTLPAIDRMLKRLGTNYVDLVFFHQPVGDVFGGWKDLECAVQQGKVRALGISNFDKDEAVFDQLLQEATIKPQVMQLECHPQAQRAYWQKKIKDHDIIQTNWYPLGGRQSNRSLLRDPIILKIAEAHKKTPAQIILRWHVQSGFVVIPGSSNPHHIEDNFKIFDFSLTEQEMEAIHALDQEKRIFNPPYEKQKALYLKMILID